MLENLVYLINQAASVKRESKLKLRFLSWELASALKE